MVSLLLGAVLWLHSVGISLCWPLPRGCYDVGYYCFNSIATTTSKDRRDGELTKSWTGPFMIKGAEESSRTDTIGRHSTTDNPTFTPTKKFAKNLFQEWQRKFQKIYPNRKEWEKRFLIWMANHGMYQ